MTDSFLMVVPPKNRLKTVPANLVAVFDASGKEETGLVVVAGFVSSQADWQNFDREWRAVETGWPRLLSHGGFRRFSEAVCRRMEGQ